MFLLKKCNVVFVRLRFPAARPDSTGMPIVRPDGTFVVETVTIREYLTNSGLDLEQWL
jgi:hypothetical protein